MATIQMPADTGGANWPGGSFDPETNRLFIPSHTGVFTVGIVPANPAQSDFGYVTGQVRAGGPPAVPAGEGDAGAAGARGGGTARGRREAAAVHRRSAAVRARLCRVRRSSSRPTIGSPRMTCRRRARLAEDAQLDARRHQEQPGAEGSSTAPSRPARPHVHRHADDEDAPDRRRGRRARERRGSASGAAARLRQGHWRRCGRRHHARQADRLADDLHDQRQAVHRRRRHWPERGAADRVRVAVAMKGSR